MWESATVQCPWCGERFEASIDPGAATSDYIEDCPVCCRPIAMHLDAAGDGFELSAGRDD